MYQEAFELFLAESSALAIKYEVAADVAFASALHKRHKIRRKDLMTLLEAVNGTPEDTYWRGFGVILLHIYCGAAYADPCALAKLKILKSGNVRPHWAGDGGMYTLEQACLSEPMNLFAGWGIYNTSGNKDTFDRHLVTEVAGNARGTGPRVMTAMESEAPSNTPLFQVGVAMGSKSATMSFTATPPSSAPPSPKLTPHSQMMDHKGFHKLIKPYAEEIGERENPKPSKEKFNALKAKLQESTVAGRDHYKQLMESITNIIPGGKRSKLYKTIEKADERWSINRNQLAEMCTDFSK